MGVRDRERRPPRLISPTLAAALFHFYDFFSLFLLVLGLALARMSKGSLLQALHSQSSACTSLPASLKLFFF